jgi:tetratricopeptide (TPR) repeat protein
MSTPGRLERFLFGILPESDTASLISDIKTDQALRQKLESESAIEAQAHTRAWWTHQSPIHAPELFSQSEWQTMIDRCFAEAEQSPVHTARTVKVIAFPQRLRYLAAACLIGAIAVSIVITRQLAKQSPDSRVIAIGQIQRISDTSAPAIQSVSRIVFDSLTVYGSTGNKPVFSRKNDGIFRISDKTAVLVEKDGSLEITNQTDSAVAIALLKGDALFSVEKKRYQRFSVQTPSSEIIVTGTVFKLSIKEQSTILSVFEGTVLARGLNDSSATVVCGGMSARISASGVTLEPGDTAALMPHQPNLLRDFLMENGVWENGAFVRTGIESDESALNQNFLSLRRSIISGAQGIDSLTFAFARSYPNSSMTGELLLDLSEMHLGRGDTAACFAILDSILVFGDNDHIAEAFNRSAQLYLESQKKPASARYAILRYLSRFPYDPRSLDLLGRFVDTLWKKQDLAEAQDVLLQATKLTAPNARLEAIVFRHAQRLQSVAGRFTQAIDWYLYLADQYPGGTYRTRALDSATRCVIRSGLHRHENYSHRINDFLHPDGLKR